MSHLFATSLHQQIIGHLCPLLSSVGIALRRAACLTMRIQAQSESHSTMYPHNNKIVSMKYATSDQVEGC